MGTRLERSVYTLKGLVIGMGVLIVIGVGLLVYGFVREANEPDGTPVAASDAASRPTAFGTVDLALPAGCRIAEMRPTDDRLFLRLEGDENCRRIIVVDLGDGSVLGEITLGGAP